MSEFSSVSTLRLETCHPDLQRLFNEVVKHYDCSILCGHRGEADQNAAFDSGNSPLQYPDSLHNKMPSLAVDVAPYPIDWDDIERFHHFAGFVEATALALGVKIKWGGRFKNFDGPHFELVMD